MSDEPSISERPSVETDSFPDASGADQTLAIDGSGQAAAPSSGGGDPLLGTTIDGKYVVERLIGVGGMGRVYRGRNTRTDGPVAIKTLLPDLAGDDSLVKRFEIEAQSASKLAHPNTIRIFDFGREGDLLFMVMELLDGEPLEKLVESEQRIAPARLVDIMMQVCRSLAEAHAAGLVHRDMKPDNIFLNRVGSDTNDHVKVLDFGVAKLRQKSPGQATLTQAGMIFGTPRYMSPEQARAFEIDGRSDIYSLGVIMFECLTGKPPFDANDAVSILVKHVNEPIPAFASVAPDLAAMPDLEEIVRRCMAKEPDDRFDDVETLLNALDSAAARYSRYGTDPALVGSGATMSMNQGGAQTPPPAKVSTGAFDALGVGAGDDSTRFTMGQDVAVPASGSHAIPDKKSFVGVVVVAVVLLAGVAGMLLALVGGDPAPPPEGTADVADDVAASAPDLDAVTSASSAAVASSIAAAVDVAEASVVELTLDVTPASATVRVDDDAPRPTAEALAFVQSPDDGPREVTLVFEADGYQPTTRTLLLPEAAATPVQVALERPPRRDEPREERPTREEPVREEPVTPPGGLPDPFANTP